VRIEYFQASKYGNGLKVAEEFRKRMATKGVTVNVHHVRDARPKELPPAGTKYAILTTEGAPQPDKKTGRMPTEEEMARWQRVIPIMNKLLQEKGLVKLAEGKVLVTGLKGPLEEGWQKKVEAFAAQIPIL
jgi:hypothetical protein